MYENMAEMWLIILKTMLAKGNTCVEMAIIVHIKIGGSRLDLSANM